MSLFSSDLASAHQVAKKALKDSGFTVTTSRSSQLDDTVEMSDDSPISFKPRLTEKANATADVTDEDGLSWPGVEAPTVVQSSGGSMYHGGATFQAGPGSDGPKPDDQDELEGLRRWASHGDSLNHSATRLGPTGLQDDFGRTEDHRQLTLPNSLGHTGASLTVSTPLMSRQSAGRDTAGRMDRAGRPGAIGRRGPSNAPSVPYSRYQSNNTPMSFRSDPMLLQGNTGRQDSGARPKVSFATNAEATPSSLQYHGPQPLSSTPVSNLKGHRELIGGPEQEGASGRPPRDGVQLMGNLPNVMAPTAFDGLTDVSAWLKKFTAFSRLKGWSAEEQLAAMPCFFRGSATLWFDSLEGDAPDTLEKLVAELKKRYGFQDAERWGLLSAWEKRNQGAEESVDDYFLVIKKMGRLLKKGGDDIRDRAIRGLRPHLMDYVMEKEPRDTAEALKLAKKASCIKQHREGAITPSVAALSAQIAALQSSLGSEMQEVKERVMAVSTNRDLRSPSSGFGSEGSKGALSAPSRSAAPPIHTPQARDAPSPSPPQRAPTSNGGYGRRDVACFRCGGQHPQHLCRHLNTLCYRCGSVGHLGRMCQQAKPSGGQQ